MEIREYKTSDCNEIADLFYNTVHYINSKDYTEEQLNVWAVHKDYQNIGIATALCDILEKKYDVEHITTHASITSKSFFEKRGYIVIKKQFVDRNGVRLTNYIMKK
ncbi:GNAT family N-acetyltransferase [Romboutsia ilealis]|uniref:GNAT family N-acetyltransferase n=1 Tax=Romboutsia faecis TaxID=2764597 RepID=A0ABR7JRV7_9FIRM|nr:GNAT family N-acetyltransferase [Romboutsia faecis]MBC5997650.1 GNAT family N-acetyltransferase [Romboutsia faecis]MRN25401.1 GNAT family N-acetyltransferase [Romboutsia ilealis]